MSGERNQLILDSELKELDVMTFHFLLTHTYYIKM